MDDFKKMITPLEHVGVRLAGGNGEGQPEITAEEIVFNGIEHCGHTERDLGITWPSSNAKGVAVLSMQHRNGNDTKENVDGQWFAGLQLNMRTCGGDCSHETFYFPQVLETVHTRKDGSTWEKEPIGEISYYSGATPVYSKKETVGKYFDCTKTAYKPYDLAVNIALVIAKHHLGDQVIVHSDGEIKDWQDGMAMYQHFLGYGEDFTLDGE